MPSADHFRHLAAKARRLAKTQSSAETHKALTDYALECEEAVKRIEERDRQLEEDRADEPGSPQASGGLSEYS